MPLKPWYKVVTPREDLREGKPLDASEFAVHLDQVRDRRAPQVYQEPEQFLAHTFLTKTLTGFAGKVLRRLAGETTGCSASYNLTTQFGGGKTHALTLAYHLARCGDSAARWPGVGALLQAAAVGSVPEAATAVFVGTEFDSLTGRGGEDGTPLRRTPWGEIAWQLGGETAFAAVAEHDRQFIEPKGDVIRAFLPKDRPCLILMDEVINYVSTYRKLGYHNALYNFVQSLSETVRGVHNAVLVVSLPASEMEYTAEDEQDQNRFEHMLTRLGEAVLLAAETETAEIIRRRLFEWDERAVTADGRVLLPRDAEEACAEYAGWVLDHRSQLPQWFPFDHAREAFLATYPFHPTVLSVFSRKWQVLPKFQRTRGMLRLLALWVSRAYLDGYKGGHREPLIGLGTAPLDDPLFRVAVFEQLGEDRLEAAVTSDICGMKGSHAEHLDMGAVDTARTARLHRKAAAAVFFESNGGQAKDEATVPEVRLAVAEPGLDIGHVETALEALSEACYYLVSENGRYRFSTYENLNKVFADRLGSITQAAVDERVEEEVRKVFGTGPAVDRIYSPAKSGDVPNRPSLTLVVLHPDESMADEAATMRRVGAMTADAGSSGRTFKSALIWCIPDSPALLQEHAKKLLAWQAIAGEPSHRLDETQRKMLPDNVGKAARDLRDAVWRTYKHVVLLAKDNSLRHIDLGLLHPSSAESLTGHIINRLRQDDEVTDAYSPTKLVRYWPATPEWSTRALRDVFYASPIFPRLLRPDVVKELVARGVSDGVLAYVGKGPGGEYKPFVFEKPLAPLEVEISDEMFILTAEEARKHLEPPRLARIEVVPSVSRLKPGQTQRLALRGYDQFERDMLVSQGTWAATGGAVDASGTFTAGHDDGSFVVTVVAGSLRAEARVVVASSAAPVEPPLPPSSGRLAWHGELPPQKWMNFYMKVLTPFATGGGLKLQVTMEVGPPASVTTQQTEEVRVALRELGLNDGVESGT